MKPMEIPGFQISLLKERIMDKPGLVLPFSFVLCLSLLTLCWAEKDAVKFRISIIQVKTEAEAESALKKLDSGEDFAKVCGEHSVGPGKEEGGDIGYFAPGELSEPLNSEAARLKAGQYSRVIETDRGYFILKKTDVQYKGDITGTVQAADYQYWYKLASEHAEAGRYREAMEAYKQAISLNPYSAEAHYNLGLAYNGLGMYEEAVEASKLAISLSPYLAEAHYNLGFAYNALGMRKEAVKAYKQAISLNPYFAEAYINLGFAYNGLGMYEEAVEAYKQVVRMRPDSAEAHYNLGFAYFRANDRDSALEEYGKLKDLNSRYADELFSLISREEVTGKSGVREPFAIRDKIFESECIRDCDIEAEIYNAEGDTYEFRGKTLVVCNNKTTPFCYGARHTWVGRLDFGGYIFDSDKDDPLQFMVTRDKGYVYIKGKGTVTMPDRTVVVLPNSGQ
jgi:tetratricopeptide (TPR) repeat protein